MTKKPKGKRKKLLPLFIVLALVIATLLIMEDSKNRLTVTEYTPAYDNLPQAFDGYTIVQLSDLHTAQFGEDNEKLLEKVAEQKPDIIALTGDFINRADFQHFEHQAESLRGFFTKLAKIAPCYFVSGNHEWASGEIGELAAVLSDVGITYLRNEYIFLEKGGERIILAGVEDPNGLAGQITPDKLVENIRAEYPDNFILFLGHRDYWLEKYPNLRVNLILSGHAHGGVVRLPLIGGVFGTDYGLFPKYDAGLYNEGNFDMILSRGLGNYNMIPRFLNPPEIVVVKLQKK